METLYYPNTAEITFGTPILTSLHRQTYSWRSEIEFITFELNFSKTLIASSLFEAKTANSLLLLKAFSSRINSLENENKELLMHILRHQNKLNTLYHNTTSTTIESYQSAHDQLSHLVQKYIYCFQNIKIEIFEYYKYALRYQKN